MRNVKICAVTALAIAAAIIFPGCGYSDAANKAVVNNVKQIGRLDVLAVYLGDYITCKASKGKKDETVVEGFVMAKSIVSVDLGEMKLIGSPDKSRLIVELPQPDFSDIALLEEDTEEIYRSGPLSFNYRYYAQEKIRKIFKLKKNEYIEPAKKQTQKVLDGMFKARGISVEIRWRSN